MKVLTNIKHIDEPYMLNCLPHIRFCVVDDDTDIDYDDEYHIILLQEFCDIINEMVEKMEIECPGFFTSK